MESTDQTHNDGINEQDQATTGSQESQTNEQTDDKVEYATYKKLLDQRKSDVRKMREMEAKLEELQDRQQSSGKNPEEAVKALKDQIRKQQRELKQREQGFYKLQVERQVADYARELGCQDPNKLLKIISDDVQSLDFDSETLEVDRFSLKSMMENAKKEMPYFFSKSAPKFNDASRIHVNEGKVSLNKSLDELSKKEIEAMLLKMS